MANLTLAIPTELKAKMDQYPEINWSEVARQAIFQKTQVLGQMQQWLGGSSLAVDEAVTIGRQIKKRVWKRHRRPG